MAGGAIIRALHRGGYGNPAHDGELLSPYRKELDLLDENEVSAMNCYKLMKQLAAATVGGIEANRSRPADFLLENIRIETNVIEAAWKAGARRLLGEAAASTQNLQIADKGGASVNRCSRTNKCLNAIANHGDQAMRSAALQHGFDAISLMPTNLYGIGDNYHSWEPRTTCLDTTVSQRKKRARNCSCWGTGKPLREFMHADDLGEACVFALENHRPL